MSHNSKNNEKEKLPIKERNQTILRYHLSFGEFMNNQWQFTVMPRQKKQ
jgi:hypothetical protein